MMKTENELVYGKSSVKSCVSDCITFQSKALSA